jgi:hypothetical protein
MVESTEFKLAVIAYYGRQVSTAHGKITSARCMVSDAVAQYGDLRPAHLVKHSTPNLLALYGISPLEVNSPRNGVLLLDSIEKAFDRLDACFLYDPITSELLFKVLNPNLLTSRIQPSSAVELRTFADIDGATLQCPAGQLPYRRILSVHAKFSYSRALSFGWIANTAQLNTYFNLSSAGLEEPACINGIAWQQLNYTEIITTI